MTSAQTAASDPRVSAFVSAHAGTGKTKLLIDRLLRLMLAGAQPERILCLTYTKAAAAEMAIRLQRKLGGWVALPDAELNAELHGLDLDAGPKSRQAARALFARVLDLPGGMRIETIHAFCQSLLRRFPLEAAISPHFQLVDPADARAELEAAREAALPVADPAGLATLAGLVNADRFAELVKTLEANRHRLEKTLALPPEALSAAMRRAVGVVYVNQAAILESVADWPDAGPLRSQVQLAERHGSPGVKAKSGKILEWLSLPADLRAEHWEQWTNLFFIKAGDFSAPSSFANANLAKQHPGIIPACQAEQTRIEAVQEQCRAHRCAEASAALLRTAAPILATYSAAKHRRALVDYDDLIGRTRALLENRDDAAWVLFKLDGGLDHLLLDEVQDTAPAQWEIADRLTTDFFTGAGAREEQALPRTIFAVGDRKQSIYSFQGADPAEFERWRGIYERRVTQADLPWRATELAVSFRSTAPVLALVDAVAAATGPQGGVLEPGSPALTHTPARTGQAGEVLLWPMTPRPEPAEHTPWSIPDRNQAQISAPQILANQLAAWIAGEVASGTHPGDILVLVRRRIEFDRALVRALKSAGVPVAGLDRMVLTQQPAVQDLLALCRALLLPQDDLSLAEMLTSPLGNLSDDSLMELAADRRATLYESLRTRAAERPEWQLAETFFTTLLSRVDYAAPHDLLSEALGPLGARARLFARLGPQAAEPVDELLSAALLYAGSHPASLQGFLHWLELSAAEVKREGETEGDTVRIMTVHGSKGLEASLVILPDTTLLPPAEQGIAWTVDKSTGAELPLWQPNAHFACQAVQTLRAKAEAARLCEHNRLLYVALTRARDRLLICGWEPHRQQPGTWYEQTRAALAGVGAEEVAFGPWPGTALRLETAQTAPSDKKARGQSAQAVAVPDWAGNAPHWRPHPLPPEPRLPTPLAPSRPEGVELGPVPPARSPLASTGQRGRFNRGLVMHTLLQHLPDIAVEDREAAAHAYTSRPSHALDDPEAVAEEALAVLAAPDLAGLFSPAGRAEQPISGLVAGRIVSGQVDRLAVLPDRVLIADYKTNRAPPARAEDVPVLYLRQMATYRGVLAALYPDRPVTCLLIWTDGPAVMPLPAALLDKHAPA